MIDLRREGDVFVLQMSQGENRFTLPLLDGLSHALDEVAGTDGPAALVTTGSGRFYSNGLDLDWMTGDGRNEAVYTMDFELIL